MTVHKALADQVFKSIDFIAMHHYDEAVELLMQVGATLKEMDK